MADYKQIFINHLKSEGVKFTDSGDNRVSVRYSGDNMPTIDVKVIFDKDGENLVKLVVWSIAKVKKEGEKLLGAYVVCNQLNARFRWVKFYVDSDNEIAADIDAIIDEDTCGAECLQLVRRTVSIVDDAYPLIMKSVL